MNTRRFHLPSLSLLVATVLLLGCLSPLQAAAKRNVLLLISDNQNWDDVGCYGNSVIQTPHLDRLAKQGTRFQYAFATTASCGPSRAVIYTGLMTHQNGQYAHPHAIHTNRLQPKVKTIFQYLKANNYRSAILGKQHVAPLDRYPFDQDLAMNGYFVKKMAQEAEKFISDSAEQPFFLVIAYHDPHPTSRDAPEWGMRRKEQGIEAVHYDPKDVIVPGYLPDQPEVRAGLAGYYQQISRLDQGIGMVLDALKRTGKDDETLVIFTSDHGSSEPGAMATHYEPGVRIPLIVRNPLSKKQNHVSEAMVTLADLVPTILDWTETKPTLSRQSIPIPDRSFLSVMETDQAKGWDEVYLSHVGHESTMYYPMRTIRTKRYKLIWNLAWRSEYPLPIDTLNRKTWYEATRRKEGMIGPRTIDAYLFRDAVELYDLQNDPDEIVNLASDSKHSQIRIELSKKLNHWMEQTKDPWLERHRLPLPGEPEGADSRQKHRGSFNQQQ